MDFVNAVFHPLGAAVRRKLSPLPCDTIERRRKKLRLVRQVAEDIKESSDLTQDEKVDRKDNTDDDDRKFTDEKNDNDTHEPKHHAFTVYAELEDQTNVGFWGLILHEISGNIESFNLQKKYKYRNVAKEKVENTMHRVKTSDQWAQIGNSIDRFKNRLKNKSITGYNNPTSPKSPEPNMQQIEEDSMSQSREPIIAKDTISPKSPNQKKKEKQKKHKEKQKDKNKGKGHRKNKSDKFSDKPRHRSKTLKPNNNNNNNNENNDGDDQENAEITQILDALGDLMSAGKITIEDSASCQKALGYINDSLFTSSNVLRESTDPLVCVFAATIYAVTMFFKKSGFLFINDEDIDTDIDEDYQKKYELQTILELVLEWQSILDILESKSTLLQSLERIGKSKVFLTENQWKIFDAATELSTQISSIYLCCLEERINSVIMDVLDQFKSKSNTKVKMEVDFSFPLPILGNFFSHRNKIELKQFYQQRMNVLNGKELGYYIKKKFKPFDSDQSSGNNSPSFKLESDNIWKNLTYIEKIIFLRGLSNQSKLKAITFKTLEFGDQGANFLAQFLSGNYILSREDELLYKKLSQLLGSLHEQYLWKYIENENLSKGFNVSDDNILQQVTQQLQTFLTPFQAIADWNKIKRSPDIDQSGNFYRKQMLYAIERVYLGNCDISNIGVKYLVDALCPSTTIKILVLNDNKISALGGQHIGRLLYQNDFIQEIDLSNNKLGKNGIVELMLGWNDNKKYSRLKSIDLSQNGVKLDDLELDESIDIDTSVVIAEFREKVRVTSVQT